MWLLLLILIILLWVISVYNVIVAKRNNVDNAWAQIEVQLKRRHDLIPNLVKVAKGYLAYERETLENVIKARTQAMQAINIKDKETAENFLTSALRSLLFVVENYPDLKANQNMLKLQEEIISTENRIAFARQYYNDEVMRFNITIQQFPFCFVARMFCISKKELFKIEDSSQKEPPKVKL
ncbi:MAG: LemA family protein [Candidatus Omnitrophica bacterium]|nr:LemA family protein [Candidatus Omnitrophota bacterium]